MAAAPRVSIGLPVYNGEKYLSASIESVLAQTMGDLELVISDNASTDATAEICRSYADGDARVKYARNERNVGGARNYNLVFSRAVAPLFKWHTHDDVIGDRYLERCLEPLHDRTVSMTYPRIVYIDARGDEIGRQLVDDLSIPAADVGERVRRLMELEIKSTDIFWAGAFGLGRRSSYAATGLLRGFNGADQVLVLQMVLRGKFVQVDEALYFRRDHPEASMAACPTPKDILRWFDPDIEKRFILPHWKLLAEHVRSIHEMRLGARASAIASLQLLRRFSREWRNFPGDVRIATRDLRDSYRGSGVVTRA
jgi:glycosyltransferase involved in cell wall biosynthesis